MAEKTEKPEKSAKAARPDKGGEKGKRKEQKGQQAAPAEAKAPEPPEPKLPPRLRVRFEEELAAALMRELKIENKMRVPRLEKITINMALNEARDNVKILDAAVEELRQITGQKPVLTRARKAISNFKLREGMPIGVMVTLRRERQGLRWPRQLFAWSSRAYDFPRAQPRQGRQGEGTHSIDHDQRQE